VASCMATSDGGAATRTFLVTCASEFQGMGVVRLLSAQHPQARVVCQDRAFAAGGRDPGGVAFLRELGLAHGAVELLGEREPPAIAAALGDQVDVLINNDAFPAVKKEVTAVAAGELARTLSELTVFPFELTSLLLKPMIARKRGKVLFLTSATPLRGLPNYSCYVVARGATNAMAVTLAQEVARHNIQVNAVAVRRPRSFGSRSTRRSRTQCGSSANRLR
jgi:NAD(P)-dependent dehydrogenase (short-subunit alcohol dehydrogenase family)